LQNVSSERQRRSLYITPSFNWGTENKSESATPAGLTKQKTKQMELPQNSLSYAEWLKSVKERIRLARVKVALAANSELLNFYWDLGKMISGKEVAWGSKLIERVAKDLQADFPEMKGLSTTNLKYCRQFYRFYTIAIGQKAVAQIGNETESISQQLVDQLETNNNADIFHHSGGKLATQIPWGHNIHIFTKAKSHEEAVFYIQQTIENGWSRDVLALQIKSQLYSRQGKAINNFQITLPEPQSDLAIQTLKDPYIFDFTTMTKPFHEKDIEDQLLSHITKFLLELGKGFAFVGRQYHLLVGETDYKIDLLFYHIKLST
jgi:predicted nuclease of restriction endonuclease-like (RecB) superfamily